MRIKKIIKGKGNEIVVGNNTIITDSEIRIVGNNNRIVFGENIHVGKNCSFWMEGNGISIMIGSGTTFVTNIHLCAQEDGTIIKIGKDCMLSNTIIIRTSDSHPIYQNGKRINSPQNVFIGDRVWIAPNSKVFKGATIGNGCIIGSDTLANKSYPANSLIVGHPGKVIKSDVVWTREKLF